MNQNFSNNMSAEINRLMSENNALRKEIGQLQLDIQTNLITISSLMRKNVDLENALNATNKDLEEHTEFIYQKGYDKGYDDGYDAADGRY